MYDFSGRLWNVTRHRTLQRSIHEVVIRCSGTWLNTHHKFHDCLIADRQNKALISKIWSLATKSSSLSLVTNCIESFWRLENARSSLLEGARETATGKDRETMLSLWLDVHTLHRFTGSARRRNARRSALSTTRCRFRGIRPLSPGRPSASR